LIGGIGIALVRIDAQSRQKDERRFGPLSIGNMGLGYYLLGMRYFRWTLVVFFVSFGVLLMGYGLEGIRL
jgi:hypothetical protein